MTTSTQRPAVLGLNIFGHDASAALVDRATGRILFAIAEERLNNIKHTWNFPIGSVGKCRTFADEQGLTITDVAVNCRPVDFIDGTLADELRRLTGDTPATAGLLDLLRNLIPVADFDQDHGSFSAGIIDRHLAALEMTTPVRRELRRRIRWFFNWAVKYHRIALQAGALFPEARLHPVNHHDAHAACAYFNSGFEKATILTLDGQGESDTLAVYEGIGGKIRRRSATRWPFSLGMFYLSATQHLGFVQGDEFKVMGMAAYGTPRYADLFRPFFQVDDASVLTFRESRFYRRDEVPGYPGHFHFCLTRAFRRVVRPRSSRGAFRQEHFDFAASVQQVLEEVGCEIAEKAIRMTGLPSVVLSGGVALNGLMNNRIRLLPACRELFVFPAAADDGASAGAAQAVAPLYQPVVPRKLDHVFLGGSDSMGTIERLLRGRRVRYSRPPSIHEAIASALADHKVVARFCGRSEFGPRALGNRSILANADKAEMKDILNVRIKHREPFRPFAPACLLEHARAFFDLDGEAPYMLLVVKARPPAVEKVPAIVHRDGTARVQTVDRESHPVFHQTLCAFHRKTGIPVILNTSFNINGEAIVETAEDALESFGQMDVDYLALEDAWISKDENRQAFPPLADAEYLQVRQKRFREAVTHPLARFDIQEFYYDALSPFRTLYRKVKARLPAPLVRYLQRLIH